MITIPEVQELKPRVTNWISSQGLRWVHGQGKPFVESAGPRQEQEQSGTVWTGQEQARMRAGAGAGSNQARQEQCKKLGSGIKMQEHRY